MGDIASLLALSLLEAGSMKRSRTGLVLKPIIVNVTEGIRLHKGGYLSCFLP